MGGTGGKTARRLSCGNAGGRRAGQPSAAWRADHRRERRVLRCGKRLCGMHRGHPGSAAPSGTRRERPVSGSSRDPQPRTGGGNRSRLPRIPAPGGRQVRRGEPGGVDAMLRRAVLVLVVASSGAAVSQQGARPPADLVVTNAHVVTVDGKFSTAGALAVRDGRVVAGGADQDVRPYIAGSTRVIGGRGRTVLPRALATP